MDKEIKKVKSSMDKKMNQLASMDKKLDKKCEARREGGKGEKNGRTESHKSAKVKRKAHR